MRTVSTIMLLVLMVGCAPKYVDLGPHPTKERIKELSRIDKPIEERDAPFKLYTTPGIVLAYTDFRLTCMLPAGAQGRYKFGVIGSSMTERDVDRRQLTMVVRAGCDVMQAVCVLAQRGPGEVPKTHTRMLDIQPAGECR